MINLPNYNMMLKTTYFLIFFSTFFFTQALTQNAAKRIINNLPLCSEAARWTHNGRDLVRDYRSQILLVAFPPLHNCENVCEDLTWYEEMSKILNDNVRIILIVTASHNAQLVRDIATRYVKFRFEHETVESPVWQWFGANDYDHFIFDRCSRLANKITFDEKFTTTLTQNNLQLFTRHNAISLHFHNTLGALKSALNYANCGWCQYDKWNRESIHDATNEKVPKNTFTMVQNRGIQSENDTKFEYYKAPATHWTATSQGFTTQPHEIPTLKVHPLRIVIKVPPPTAASITTTQTTNDAAGLDKQLKFKNSSSFNGGNSLHQRSYLQNYASTATAIPFYYGKDNNAVQQQQQRSNVDYRREVQQQQQLKQQSQQRNSEAASQTQAPQYDFNPKSYHHAQQPHFYQQQHPQQQHPQQQQAHLQQKAQLQQEQQYLYDRKNRLQDDKQSFKYYNEQSGLPTSTKQTSIQYGRDLYAGRYQYRLDSAGHREAQQQRAEERRREMQARSQQEAQRQKQFAELQRLRAQQQEQIRQQKLLEQRQAELKRKLEEENTNKQQVDLNAVDPAPLYPEGSENFDYYEDENSWTTPPSYLSASSSQSSTYAPRVWPTQTESRDYIFNLPCEGYSDEICYQQQLQFQDHEVHQCCKNRVLFTDQCVPGKCSNITQQLCCIQKFLQAKLSCCSDEKQLEVNVPGDNFSRCCHQNFITDNDNCCTRVYASEQWRTAHELCLPNVDVDLSRVRVPTLLSGTSLTTEFDFSKTDKWNFTCRFGSHVPQFSYIGDSTPNEIN